MNAAPAIAYLAEGKLYLKEGQASPRLIESPFVQQIYDRIARNRQRNEWKNKGPAWQISAAGLPSGACGPPAEARRIRFTGIARGANSTELMYALDTDYACGLFTMDVAENYERRLVHRNELKVEGLSRHAGDGALACSLRNEDGSANIAILEADGGGLKEVTEGDSVDEAPGWVSGQGKVLVFQSAGIGRNPQGLAYALGPYIIQKLNIDRGELTTLVEEHGHDHLLPRMTADGTLYFLRRPYQPYGPPVSPFRVLADIVLFPFRLVRAIVHFLDFFSQMFSRKPLITAGGPPREAPQSRYMMLWGKIIDTEKAMRSQKRGKPGSLVPSTWQLIRRSPAGAEDVLAKAVISYDLCPDGSLVYTDGATVLHRAPDGQTRELCAGRMIECVSVVG